MSLSLAPLSLPALTLQLRPLPSAVVTRFIGTMGRSDSHPGLTCPSREFSWRLPPPAWVSRVASFSLQTCRRHYPGGPLAADCSGLLTALCSRGRRPSLYPARSASPVPELKERPARRSPTKDNPWPLLRPVYSPDHPSMIRLTSEASADSLPPRLFRLLPGGTINLPSGTFTR